MLALYLFIFYIIDHLDVLPFCILLLAFFKFYNFGEIILYYNYIEELYKPTKLLENYYIWYLNFKYFLRLYISMLFLF